MKILVCNAGSTSLKYKLFEMPQALELAEGRMERVGGGDAIYTYRRGAFERRREDLSIPSYSAGIGMFLRDLLCGETGALGAIGELDAVSFKTVTARGYHGIHEITGEVMQGMREYLPVAPVHNACYLEAIEVFRELLPETLLVGVFETAFHATIPLERRLYAVPYEWYEAYGIERLGFHGASHGYIADEITRLAGPHYRLISCHLGGSGSICAVLDGKSVDTSFGFSLQTGIPHANRVGDLDAFVLPFLVEKGMRLEEVLRELNRNGGLLGISGVSNDLRFIEEEAARGNARAKLAIGVFCNSIVKYIGAFFAELGGLDHLVFTGGIGENSVAVRETVCNQLGALGVSISEERNRAGEKRRVVSDGESRVQVHVIPANEELGLARKTYEFAQARQ